MALGSYNGGFYEVSYSRYHCWSDLHCGSVHARQHSPLSAPEGQDGHVSDFWVKRMPKVDIQPHWKGKEENTGVPVLIVSNGKLEFKDKMNAVCDVRPVVMVKKDKFIDVVLNQS